MDDVSEFSKAGPAVNHDLSEVPATSTTVGIRATPLDTTLSLDIAEKLLEQLKVAHHIELDINEQLLSLQLQIQRLNDENRQLKEKSRFFSEEQLCCTQVTQNRHLSQEQVWYAEVAQKWQDKFHRQVKILDEIAAARKPFTNPPSEILYQIFKRAIPPSFLLNSAIASGPDSSWCQAMRLKRAISLVCRAWNITGTQLLYEDVVFRHIGQIPAFLRSLEANPDELKTKVKTININCFIPRGYDTLFDTQLQRIIAICPRLYHFGFTPVYTRQPLLTLPILNSSITHVEFGREVDFSTVWSTLHQISHQLISLSFYITEEAISITKNFRLYLSQLETLSCTAKCGAKTSLSIIPDLWSLPRLQNLTLKLESGSDANLNICHSVIAVHGLALIFLHIHEFPASRFALRDQNLQAILDSCPVLEHLVLPSQDMAFLRHSTVLWIDLWVHGHTETIFTDSPTTEAFPALRGVRILDESLCEFPNVPTIISPDMALTTGEIFEFRHPGIYVRYENGHLYRGEAVCVQYFTRFKNTPYGIDYNSDDSDDSDFVFDLEEDDNDQWSDTLSSSKSEADSDDDNELNDEFYLEEKWEADPDTTVDIHRQLADNAPLEL